MNRAALERSRLSDGRARAIGWASVIPRLWWMPIAFWTAATVSCASRAAWINPNSYGTHFFAHLISLVLFMLAFVPLAFALPWFAVRGAHPKDERLGQAVRAVKIAFWGWILVYPVPCAVLLLAWPAIRGPVSEMLRALLYSMGKVL